ncbi:MAG: carboxypeptidase M32, partial [Phycisphaeraceae bacterium]|nr:carboxypeptidase M32 [Phycisphaeraceae bacterium]
MSTTTTAPYERLLEILNEEAVLGSIGGLIGWDQETMMPAGGATHRAKQLSLLARLGHERMTSSEVADLLAACESEMDVDADTEAAANVRNIRHDHDRAVRLPASLVQEHAETASAAQHEWAEARNDNDFKRFLPWLEKTVDICRRKAECYGWAEGGEPWDALAEDYEPGCTAAGVA